MIVDAMMKEFDLSESEQAEIKTAQEKDGEPTTEHLLIMQYHIATEKYADRDNDLRNLHELTKGYFFSRYPNTVRAASTVIDRRKKVAH